MTKEKWILLILAIILMNIAFKIYGEWSKDYIRNRETTEPAIESQTK